MIGRFRCDVTRVDEPQESLPRVRLVFYVFFISPPLHWGGKRSVGRLKTIVSVVSVARCRLLMIEANIVLIPFVG